MQKKKSLGQHFLRSQGALAAVAEAADLKPGEYVLEIGPGDGALTKHLLNTGAHVIAVEKDRRLIPILTDMFAGQQFAVHEGDALEASLDSLDIQAPYKVVGNIPYYITGALIKKFLTAEMQPSRLVFLVQKEVAERIARSNKESILSLSVKAYGAPKYVKTVPRGAFSPPPKVDSAILLVEDISRKNFTSATHEHAFFDLLHAGFGSKRKLLIRNVEKVLGNRAAEAFMHADIAPNARAEDVPLTKWLALAQDV
jgi:16S rRNA (adenine1518-N6/adenine1519-N6)-dimethyltransferase